MQRAELRATRAQIERFKKSFIWRDMVRELESWKEGFRDEPAAMVRNALDLNPSTAATLMYLGDISGRIQAIEYIIAMPDVFLSLLGGKKDGS
jgi:hypothetical protein